MRSYAGSNAGNTVRQRARIMAAQAIQNYDPQKSKLTTHVMSQLQALRRVAPNVGDPIPKPERLRIESAKLARGRTELADTIGREPTIEELADHMNFDVRQVRRLISRDRAAIPESSLSTGEGEEDEYMPGVTSRDPRAIWADYVYHDLDPIDKLIFQHRTGYNGAPIVSNQELARMTRLSAPAVSRRAARIQERMDELVMSGI